MDKLNYDCLNNLFDNFSDRPDGCGLLFTCALLNRYYGSIASHHLYKDPWKYWLFQCRSDDIARKLINTYMLCYNYHVNKIGPSYPSREGDDDEENPSKRRKATDENRVDDNIKLPYHDYISFTQNLHVPSLYQCIKSWYTFKHNDYDEENGPQKENQIYNYFLRIFELFVESANIKHCTFAESIDESYPVTLDQLVRLIIDGKKDLKYLNLGYFQIDSDGISRITGKCNNLKTFKISAQKCSDEALARFIASQKRLTKLKIRNAEKIDLTLDALEALSESLVKIRILSSNLVSCQKPFDGIASCSNLRSIYMRNTNWSIDVSTSTLLMPIAQRCEFHNVDFSRTYLPADVLVEIAKKSSITLRKVHLIGPENQIDHEKFDLSAGIEALADHSKNIVHFERDILPKEMNSMIYFINSIGNSLIRLEIESQLMKPEHIDASGLILSISYCTKLEVLNISYFNFSSQAFEKLIVGCVSLTDLTVCNSMSVNDDILNIIREKCSGNLRTLDIFGCNQVSEAAAEQLYAETEIEVDILGDPKEDRNSPTPFNSFA